MTPPGLVGVPAMEWQWTEAVSSQMALVRGGLPPGSSFEYVRGPHSIAWLRNQIVFNVLENPAFEWVLFLDSDMVVPPQTVTHLWATGKDIVAAAAVQRAPPFGAEWTFAPAAERESGVLREVTHVGAACLLVRRHVLETIAHPWFDHPTPGELECLFFVDRARAHGFKVFVDLSLSVGHVGVYPFDPAFAAGWQDSTGLRERVGSASRRAHADAVARFADQWPA